MESPTGLVAVKVVIVVFVVGSEIVTRKNGSSDRSAFACALPCPSGGRTIRALVGSSVEEPAVAAASGVTMPLIARL